MESYEKALAVDTKNLDASWRYARASYWIAVYVEDSEERARVFKRAIDLTKRAVSIDEKSVANHFWLGVSYAKYGEAKGVMSSLGLIKPIRKQMERVIALDESFAGGGAHRLLGWIEHKLPGIAGGSDERAVEHLEKAVALDGNHLLNRLCLGEVYRKTGRLKEAKVHLEFIVKAPYERDRRPENELEKEGAKELLAKIAQAERESER
jgi:tetratricopeptide (TPR) repeat protein